MMRFVWVALLAMGLWTGCGGDDEPERRPAPNRTRDVEGGGGGGGGGGTNCYDAGYEDCAYYYYYSPDPAYWGCSGAAEDDYWAGYCECEYDFGAYYWC